MNEREMTSEELELLERLNNKYSGQWPQLREVEEEKSRLETAAFTISRDRDKLAKERDNLTAEIEALKEDREMLEAIQANNWEVCSNGRGVWSVLEFNGVDETKEVSKALSLRTAIRQAMKDKSI